MNVSNTEMFGIVMGCIPGINIAAGLIKFFIYLNKEAEINNKLFRQLEVDRTAKKVNNNIDIPEIKNGIEETTSKLKWYALAQMIPLIGIIGAIYEKNILEFFNKHLEPKLNEVDSTDGDNKVMGRNPPWEKTNSKFVLELSDDNFEATIEKGTVAVLFFADIDGRENDANEPFEQAAKELANQGITFAQINAYDGWKTHNKLREKYGVPLIILYQDGQIVRTTGEFQVYQSSENIKTFIQA